VEQDGPAVDKDEIAQMSSPKKEPSKKATPPRRPNGRGVMADRDRRFDTE
jgi:hypothetical protein